MNKEKIIQKVLRTVIISMLLLSVMFYSVYSTDENVCNKLNSNKDSGYINCNPKVIDSGYYNNEDIITNDPRVKVTMTMIKRG